MLLILYEIYKSGVPFFLIFLHIVINNNFENKKRFLYIPYI